MKTRFFNYLTKLQQSIIGGTVILGIASLLSRVLGLMRDRIISGTFGVGTITDSYFTAFKVPDFLFNILVLGVISASFVPIYIEQREKHNKEAANDVATAILNIVFAMLLVLSIFFIIFTPQLAHLLASKETGATHEQTVLFMRLMFGALMFFGLSNVFAGVLHANKRFVVYALAPLLYNIGIIVGVLFLVPAIGVIGLPLGVVLGAGMHALIQLPAVIQEGFRYKPIFMLRSPAVRKMLLLAPPRAFSLGLSQINVIVLFAIAATIREGSRTVFQYADNLQNFPINIIGVSLALAAFPAFSEAFANNDIKQYKKVFSENFRRILFFIIPIAILTLLLRSQIVRLVYGTAKFTWADTYDTAQLLGIFTLSMLAQAAVPLLTRSYFAKQDTITPVLISVFEVMSTIGVALWLAPRYGIIGIGIAYTLSSLGQMLLLLFGLRWKYGDLDDEHIISSTWKIIFATIGMAIVAQGMKYSIAQVVDMQTWIGIFLQTSAAVIAGGIVYIEMARKFQFEEAEVVRAKIIAILKTIRQIFRPYFK